MSDHDALLRAICADPDDDTPRLVAADWLEEHGDADRAAFIRVQVELARLEASGHGKSLEADDLRKKERGSLGPSSYSWRLWAAEACPQLVRVVPGDGTNPLTQIHVEGADRLTFRRGFVEAVECPAALWLEHGSTVRGQQPVRDIHLTHGGQLTRDNWYAMFRALRGLRQLVLDGCEVEMFHWLRGQLRGVQVYDYFPF
jgi:uncharacterized protein (TIGR02996 family)